MVRMERHIKAALTNSDYAIVSIHSHQMKGRNENEPDYFLKSMHTDVLMQRFCSYRHGYAFVKRY